MHNATQSNTTITTHCTTSTELLLSGADDSSVTRRTSFKLQQCCHYFVSNPCTLNCKALIFRRALMKCSALVTFVFVLLYTPRREMPNAVLTWRDVSQIASPFSLFQISEAIQKLEGHYQQVDSCFWIEWHNRQWIILRRTLWIGAEIFNFSLSWSCLYTAVWLLDSCFWAWAVVANVLCFNFYFSELKIIFINLSKKN